MEVNKIWFLVFFAFLAGAEYDKADCPRPVNIVFVLDSSEHINNQTFQRCKTLIKSIADFYQIRPGQTDMAVILFSVNANTAVHFGQNKTHLFKQEVEDLPYLGGTSSLRNALYLAADQINSNRAIPHGAKAVVVMTTGLVSSAVSRNSSAVKWLKNGGSLRVFVVEVEKDRDKIKHLHIASDLGTLFNLEELLTVGEGWERFTFLVCASPGDLRLFGAFAHAGRLEVYQNRKWSSVCHPTWNDTLSDLICQRLGFHSNSTSTNSSFIPLSFLNMINENGDDSNGSLSRETICNESNAVKLVCKVPVRLTRPQVAHIGLVEVHVLGRWGAVCSDSINMDAATIVCRILGFSKALATFVDVSTLDRASSLMLMKKMKCEFDSGPLEQSQCCLKTCGTDGCAMCLNRPASVICDTRSDTLVRNAYIGEVGGILTRECKHGYNEIKWYFENSREHRAIFANGTRIRFYLKKIGRVSKLIITKVQLSDAGPYFCDSLSRKEMFLLYINVDIEDIPKEQFLYLGQHGKLFCNVTGSPPPFITWYRHSNQINCDTEKYSLRQNGVLIIKNVGHQDVGTYLCKIFQNFGNTESTDRRFIQLRIYDKPTATIVQGNQTQNGSEATLTLTCNATGQPRPAITWYLNNSTLNYKIYTIMVTINETDAYTLNTLTKKRVSKKWDTGMYTCTATNTQGYQSASVWVAVEFSTETPSVPEKAHGSVVSFPWQSYIGIPLVAVLLVAIGLGVWFARRNKILQRKIQLERMSCSRLKVLSSNCFEVWELPRKALQLQKIIGSGAFGEVWKAVAHSKDNRCDDQMVVAVKKAKDSCSTVQRRMLEQEIEVNKTLAGRKHANIVNFLGCITDSESVMMVLEYVPYGDLLGYLRERRGVQDKFYYHCEELPGKDEVSPYELFSFAKQISCGMCFLSEMKIIHRDLAARNVLVGDNLTCKITDFGLAKIMKDDKGYMGTRKGRLPIKWTAPEVFFGDDSQSITSQSDVWSYGITLYEIFTIGGDPYPGLGEWDIVYRLKHDKFHMSKPDHVSDKIYAIMVSCWCKEPQERPTFDELHENMIEMVEQDHYLDLDMTKYQGNLYISIFDEVDDDMCI